MPVLPAEIAPDLRDRAEGRVVDRPEPDAEPEEIVEAEIIAPEGEPPNDTPPRIAKMIKAGAFDRKPGQRPCRGLCHRSARATA